MNIIKAAAAAVILSAFVLGAGCGKKDSESGKKVNFYDSENPYVPPETTNNITADSPIGEMKELGQDETGGAASLTASLGRVQIFGGDEKASFHSVPTDYISCKFTIQNNGKETYTVSTTDDFRVVSGDERSEAKISAFMFMATSEISDYNELNTAEIAPGESFTGDFLLEQPTGWSEFEVQLIPHSENDNNDALSFKITSDMVS